MTLAEFATNTDKLQHNYLPHYERHLDPSKIKILVEIGVNAGGSLEMWKKWLPSTRVIGVEIDHRCAQIARVKGLEIVEADASEYVPDYPMDVVVDDGSHEGDDQYKSFGLYWPKVTPGGWYIIEDLETIWHEGFREGPMILSRLDMIFHAAMLGETPTAQKWDGYPAVAEVHAYEQIIFIKKRA